MANACKNLNSSCVSVTRLYYSSGRSERGSFKIGTGIDFGSGENIWCCFAGLQISSRRVVGRLIKYLDSQSHQDATSLDHIFDSNSNFESTLLRSSLDYPKEF